MRNSASINTIVILLFAAVGAAIGYVSVATGYFAWRANIRLAVEPSTVAGICTAISFIFAILCTQDVKLFKRIFVVGGIAIAACVVGGILGTIHQMAQQALLDNVTPSIAAVAMGIFFGAAASFGIFMTRR